MQDSSTYYLLGASVVDGTQCGADTFDACVAGQCIAAGCDHVLGSGMKLGLYTFGEQLIYHYKTRGLLFSKSNFRLVWDMRRK